MVSETPTPVSITRVARPIPPFLLSLGVVLVAFVLYASTLSKHYSEGEDSSWYVHEVTSPSSTSALFWPNHLIFNAVNRVIYLICLQAGYQGNACLPMQIVNAAAGALSLGIMVRILRRLGVDDRLTLSWVGVTAVCYGFWSYSSQAETYTLPLIPLLMCVDLIIGLSDDRFSYKTFAWLGCLASIATLLHQQHVLFLVAIMIAVLIIGYRYRSEVPISRVVMGLAVFGVVSAVIVGTAYFYVAIGIEHLREPEAIIRWSRGHANNPNAFNNTWSYSNPIKSLMIGFARSVLGGHFLYGFDRFDSLVARLFPKQPLLEERYIAHHLSSATLLTSLAAAVAALISTLAVIRTIWFPTQVVPMPVESRRRSQAALTIISLVLVEYYIFNSIVEPLTIEYWIAMLPMVAIAMALVQSHRPRATQWWFAVTSLMLSLFVANGLGSILPQSRHETDFWYQANSFLIQNAKAGDIIITEGGWMGNNILSVFTGAEVISAHQNARSRFPQILEESNSQRVWISSWCIDPLFSRFVKTRPLVDDATVQRLIQANSDRLIKRDEGRFQTIWELAPAKP